MVSCRAAVADDCVVLKCVAAFRMELVVLSGRTTVAYGWVVLLNCFFERVVLVEKVNLVDACAAVCDGLVVHNNFYWLSSS